MVKTIESPKTDAQLKQELGRIADVLRGKGTKPTPFPTKLETTEDFLKINALNAHKFDPTGHSLEDLPKESAFKNAGVKYYKKVRSYLSFKINKAPDKKRKLALKAEQELKKQCGERPLDESLFGGDVEARDAAMRKVLWDDENKKVLLKCKAFTNLGGCSGFWKKRYDEQEAAKVLAAEVVEALRRSTRVRRPTKHYDPAAAAKQTGASPEDGSYPHLGVEEDEPVCSIILGEGGEEALKALGLDWVCGAWQSETALDMKLRGLMEQLSRILTIGAVTTKVHCDQALAALERELDKRLAVWYASLGAAPVAPLGASNHGDASSGPAACVGAAAADGAAVRGRAAPRFATRMARDRAASALGDDAKPPPMHVLVDAARERRLDLVRLVLDANENVRTGAARFAGDASDASAASLDADRLTRVARRASPGLKDKHAICDALDGLSLRDTQFGLLGLTLLRAGFVAFDPTTGKAVDGEPIRRMRERVAGLATGEKGRGAKFHLHHVVLVSVQLAFANKLLDFKRMRLSLFQCVFGRYLLALWAWLNGLTMTDFQDMRVPLKMVAAEVDKREFPNLSAWVAKEFPGGVKFDTAADILAVHQNANTAFAAAKMALYQEAEATYKDGAADIVSTLLTAGAEASSSVVTRGSAPAMDIGDAPPLSAGALRTFALSADAAAAGLSVPQGGDGGVARKALASFCTAAFESPEDGTALARVDAALAAGGSSGLAAATRIAADVAPRVDLDLFLAVAIYAPPPPEMTLRCKIRFHTPTVDGWNGWSHIDDFFAVIAALRFHGRSDLRSVPAWVLESPTCRAFETSGRQILAGMTLAEFTAASSLVNVFAKEADCEGVKYGTYTIFCGSDYQLGARGRAPVDKCACIVEAVKAYMASRAGA